MGSRWWRDLLIMFLPKQFNRIVSLLVLQCRASCLCVSLCPSVFLFMCFFSSCVSALGVSFMCLHVSRHISLYVSLNLFLHASGFSSVLLRQGKNHLQPCPCSLSLSFFVFSFLLSFTVSRGLCSNDFWI